MKTLELSEVAIQEIIQALDCLSITWMEGMPPGTEQPFSNTVKEQIIEQIRK